MFGNHGKVVPICVCYYLSDFGSYHACKEDLHDYEILMDISVTFVCDIEVRVGEFTQEAWRE